jgi:YidC/Oxa1 family membrane protein insertase
MERRTLLAIFLIMAVLIGDQILMSRWAKKPKAPAGVDTTQVATRADTTRPGLITPPPAAGQPASSGGSTAAGGSAPAPGVALASHPRTAPAPETTRVIRTSYYVATFSSKGGVIAHWMVPGYKDLSAPQKEVDLAAPSRAMRLIVKTPYFDYDFTDAPFRVESASDTAVTFVADDSSGVRVTKSYRVASDPRAMDIEIGAAVPAPYGPIQMKWGWGESLPHTEHMMTPRTVAAVALIGDKMERVDAAHIQKEGNKALQGNVRWAAVRSKYFVAALIPDSATVGAVEFTQSEQKEATVWLVDAAPPGTDLRRHMRLYAGPIHYDTLVAQGSELDRLANLGWRWITGVSALLLWCLNALYKLIPNYGIAIILLSAATKLVFYPLTQASLRSMKVMHHLQPEMKALQERYQGDPARMNKEVMDLYKRYKVNPLSGCLPMIVQIPVFFALYNVLLNSIELRGAGFLGYIADLSVPDVLMRVAGFPIHLFPVLMTASSYYMQSQTPVSPQQKPTMMLMPVMMLVFMYNFPSGVVLYWTVTNVLSGVQQYMVNLAEDRKMAASA